MDVVGDVPGGEPSTERDTFRRFANFPRIFSSNDIFDERKGRLFLGEKQATTTADEARDPFQNRSVSKPIRPEMSVRIGRFSNRDFV